MATPEKEVQRQIMAHIKKNGGYVVKVIMGNETGIPDLLACIGGKFVAIEVKGGQYINDPFKQASAWQKRHYRLVRESGGLSMVVASLEQFKDTLSEHKVNLQKT